MSRYAIFWCIYYITLASQLTTYRWDEENRWWDSEFQILRFFELVVQPSDEHIQKLIVHIVVITMYWWSLEVNLFMDIESMDYWLFVFGDHVVFIFITATPSLDVIQRATIWMSAAFIRYCWNMNTSFSQFSRNMYT